MEDLTGGLREHFATTNGVTRPSILNQSRYFHVIDGISPDVMHNLLEGVLQLAIMVLIKELIIKKQYFHIKILNNRITSFCYGPVESANKPSTFKESGFSSASDNGMKQTGKTIAGNLRKLCTVYTVYLAKIKFGKLEHNANW